MEELIRLAKEMNRELNHTDDAKSKEICFEASFNGKCDCNFGMQMIWIFNSPMLILGRCGGENLFHGVLKMMKKSNGQLNTSLR